MIPIDSDAMVEVANLQDAASGAYVNDATVTADLIDADGEVLANDVALNYVAGSDGRYRGYLPNEATGQLDANEQARLVVTVVHADGRTLTLEQYHKANRDRGRAV